jgi:hypothetical protein
VRGLRAALSGAVTSILLAGCGQGEGVRTEQSAAASLERRASQLPMSPLSSGTNPGQPHGADSAAPAPPMGAAPVSPPGAREKLDIVALLRADRTVSSEIRQALRPCPEETWPIEVSYGRLTDRDASDVVVNVSDCTDGRGMGSYVYQRSRAGKYVNVFTDQEPGVFAKTDNSALLVHQEIYLKDDPVCCPSGEDVVTYGWRDGEFTELDRTYNEYPDPVSSPSWEGSTGEAGGNAGGD